MRDGAEMSEPRATRGGIGIPRGRFRAREFDRSKEVFVHLDVTMVHAARTRWMLSSAPRTMAAAAGCSVGLERSPNAGCRWGTGLTQR
jgi:hypothetical protein